MRTRLVVLAVAVVALAGCSGGESGSGSIVGGPSKGHSAQGVATYGYGAAAGGVDYQPDVVVVGGGASSIRSASDDGLTWTIAKSAPGADKLEVGKIMLLTSVAAGRVAALHDSGAERVVTLAPVALTEIIRNGSLDIDQALDPSTLRYQLVPGLPWASSNPGPSSASPTPAHSFLQRSADDGVLPPATKAKLSVPVGDWTVEPSADDSGFGLGIEHDVGGLKVGVDFMFSTDDLHISGLQTVRNGVSTRSGFTVTGITGLDVGIKAGAEHGGADNGKIKIEVPIELDAPIAPSPATAGLPVNIKVTFKFLVETALTGNNATLLGTGKYKLDGPIGLTGSTVVAPKFSVEKSIIDSISGITLGPSGIVAAVSMKFQVGIGTPGLTAGPFASIIASIGLTNGSSLGASLVRCRGATLDVDLGGGAGVTLSPDVLGVLKRVLPKGTELELSTETKTNILRRQQVVPDVPACQS